MSIQSEQAEQVTAEQVRAWASAAYEREIGHAPDAETAERLVAMVGESFADPAIAEAMEILSRSAGSTPEAQVRVFTGLMVQAGEVA